MSFGIAPFLEQASVLTGEGLPVFDGEERVIALSDANSFI
jgi:hypothetical protein